MASPSHEEAAPHPSSDPSSDRVPLPQRSLWLPPELLVQILMHAAILDPYTYRQSRAVSVTWRECARLALWDLSLNAADAVVDGDISSAFAVMKSVVSSEPRFPSVPIDTPWQNLALGHWREAADGYHALQMLTDPMRSHVEAFVERLVLHRHLHSAFLQAEWLRWGCARIDDALPLYERAAEKGHPAALYTLATFYSDGLLLPQSDTKAVSLYRQAAERGHPDAMYRLHEFCLNGWGLPQSAKDADQWLERAAQASHPHSIFLLAMTHPTLEKPVLLARAAQLGHVVAMHEVGTYHLQAANEASGTDNKKRAVEYLRQAALRGYALSWDSLVELGEVPPVARELIHEDTTKDLSDDEVEDRSARALL